MRAPARTAARSQPNDGWVTRAERILADLDRDTARALTALALEDADAVVHAVESRGRALAELDDVVASLARARMRAPSIVTDTALRRVATAATQAAEAHQDLVERVSLERTRLAGAVAAIDRPDRVADRYGSRSAPAHTLSLSA